MVGKVSLGYRRSKQVLYNLEMGKLCNFPIHWHGCQKLPGDLQKNNNFGPQIRNNQRDIRIFRALQAAVPIYVRRN